MAFVLKNLFSSLKEKGWRNLPLLALLILPFYSLPGGTMKILQMQFFQLGAVMAFLLSPRKIAIKTYHPACLLAVFSMLQLFFCYTDPMVIFHIEMIIIGFLLFESVFSSGIDYKFFLYVILFFVFTTILFSINQKIGLKMPLPRYLTEDLPFLVQGIWTNQALCAAFCAFSIPYVISLKSKLKWILIAFLAWIIYETNSSFAEVSAVISCLVFVFYKSRKAFFLVTIPALAACFAHYWFFQKGNLLTPELQRFFIWKAMAPEILKTPLFGHGFGSFLAFSMKNMIGDTDGTVLAFPNAHNEFLQMPFEGGFIGLAILLSLMARVVFLMHKNREKEGVIPLGASNIAMFFNSIGQSIFHAPNIMVFIIFSVSILESINRSEKC